MPLTRQRGGGAGPPVEEEVVELKTFIRANKSGIYEVDETTIMRLIKSVLHAALTNKRDKGVVSFGTDDVEKGATYEKVVENTDATDKAINKFLAVVKKWVENACTGVNLDTTGFSQAAKSLNKSQFKDIVKSGLANVTRVLDVIAPTHPTLGLVVDLVLACIVGTMRYVTVGLARSVHLATNHQLASGTTAWFAVDDAGFAVSASVLTSVDEDAWTQFSQDDRERFSLDEATEIDRLVEYVGNIFGDSFIATMVKPGTGDAPSTHDKHTATFQWENNGGDTAGRDAYIKSLVVTNRQSAMLVLGQNAALQVSSPGAAADDIPALERPKQVKQEEARTGLESKQQGHLDEVNTKLKNFLQQTASTPVQGVNGPENRAVKHTFAGDAPSVNLPLSNPFEGHRFDVPHPPTKITMETPAAAPSFAGPASSAAQGQARGGVTTLDLRKNPDVVTNAFNVMTRVFFPTVEADSMQQEDFNELSQTFSLLSIRTMYTLSRLAKVYKDIRVDITDPVEQFRITILTLVNLVGKNDNTFRSNNHKEWENRQVSKLIVDNGLFSGASSMLAQKNSPLMDDRATEGLVFQTYTRLRTLLDMRETRGAVVWAMAINGWMATARSLAGALYHLEHPAKKPNKKHVFPIEHRTRSHHARGVQPPRLHSNSAAYKFPWENTSSTPGQILLRGARVSRGTARHTDSKLGVQRPSFNVHMPVAENVIKQPAGPRGVNKAHGVSGSTAPLGTFYSDEYDL